MLLRNIFGGKTGRDDAKTRIAQWGEDDPASLRLTQAYARIREIDRYLTHAVRGHETDAGKQKALRGDHAAEVEIGRRYCQSLDYRPEWRESWAEIARVTARETYRLQREKDVPDDLDGVTPYRRRLLGQQISNAYFDAAKEIVDASLRRAVVQIDDSPGNEGNAGWVMMHFDDMRRGRDTQIKIGADYAARCRSLGDFANTIAHEATHHSMIQLGSAAERGTLDVPPALDREIHSVLLTAELQAHSDPVNYAMYRANPFERIAFRTGNAVEIFHAMHVQADSLDLDPHKVAQVDSLLDTLERDPRQEETYLRRIGSVIFGGTPAAGHAAPSTPRL
jgi:hypothetical protein